MILRKSLAFLALMLCLAAAGVHVVQADAPIVRAVLFYSPSCPHCHQVITQALPTLFEQYGDQLEIVGIDTSQPGGGALYQAAVEQFAIPAERLGVPTLIVGETVLVGSGEIPEQFPGLIEQHLAAGGVGWPPIPGLADALAKQEGAPEQAAPAEAGPLARFAQDPVGNTLSVVMLGVMLIAVGTTVVQGVRQPPRKGAPQIGRQWVIPLLAVIGLAVAGYLAFVETTQTLAVCGPVGDCNTVQQSEYARLFGVLPVGVLGLFGYVAILAAWAVSRAGSGRARRLATLALFGMVAAGVLFSLYLTFLEPFVIGATCAWCLTSALLMTAMLVLTAPAGFAVLRASPAAAS